MLKFLTTFAALSMAGTVILSLLPDGTIRRTASLVLAMTTLICWANGIASLIGVTLPEFGAETALVTTGISMEQSVQHSAAHLQNKWGIAP